MRALPSQRFSCGIINIGKREPGIRRDEFHCYEPQLTAPSNRPHSKPQTPSLNSRTSQCFEEMDVSIIRARSTHFVVRIKHAVRGCQYVIDDIVVDLRVLLCQRPFPTLGQINAENVEIALTGHNHYMRSVAAHRDNAS